MIGLWGSYATRLGRGSNTAMHNGSSRGRARPATDGRQPGSGGRRPSDGRGVFPGRPA
ncbi:hypothetical protein SGPA1_10025 [Streptomyces misionensis JCM 4497]